MSDALGPSPDALAITLTLSLRREAWLRAEVERLAAENGWLRQSRRDARRLSAKRLARWHCEQDAASLWFARWQASERRAGAAEARVRELEAQRSTPPSPPPPSPPAPATTSVRLEPQVFRQIAPQGEQ
jgi:hypothetical protein